MNMAIIKDILMSHLADFKCLKCNYRWKSEPGPTQCPICGHLYIKWLNFESMMKQWELERMYDKYSTSRAYEDESVIGRI